MMKKLSWLLLLSLFVGWSGAVGANAQTFDVTVAVTAYIGAEGFSMSNSSVSATVSTKMNDWTFTSTTAFSLGFEFLGETLVASGKVSDYNVTNELFVDMKNPMSNALSVSTKMGPWNLKSTTALSIAMDFSKFELVGETISVNTSKDGLGLTSATTFNLDGFKSQTFTVSGSISGLSVVQSTVIGKTGLSQLIWDMSTTIDGISLFREAIYTPEGLASDSLTISGTMDKYDWSATCTFGKTGWMSKTLTVSTSFKGLGAK
jgi:hypothetical protein